MENLQLKVLQIFFLSVFYDKDYNVKHLCTI